MEKVPAIELTKAEVAKVERMCESVFEGWYGKEVLTNLQVDLCEFLDAEQSKSWNRKRAVVVMKVVKSCMSQGWNSSFLDVGIYLEMRQAGEEVEE